MPHLEEQRSSGPELGPSFFDPPLQSLQGAADDRCDRLQRWMTSRLLDDLIGLPDALAGRRRAPPERPGPPVEDVRDLPWASRALRVLKPPRPSQLRLVRPAKPGEVVACEPRGPCHSLVVAEPRQLAFGFVHLGERRVHRGCSVVLDPKLKLDEPRPVIGARIACELGRRGELLQHLGCPREVGDDEQDPGLLQQSLSVRRAAPWSDSSATRSQALDSR